MTTEEEQEVEGWSMAFPAPTADGLEDYLLNPGSTLLYQSSHPSLPKGLSTSTHYVGLTVPPGGREDTGAPLVLPTGESDLDVSTPEQNHETHREFLPTCHVPVFVWRPARPRWKGRYQARARLCPWF